MKKMRSAFLLSLLISLYAFTPSTPRAQLCWPDQCPKGLVEITKKHREYKTDIMHNNDSGYGGDSFDDQLLEYQKWLVPNPPLIAPAKEGFWRAHPMRALRLMTRQLSTFAMYQTLIIGTFLDAKQQMQTQRTLQVLTAQAHRDYTPSSDFCYFGTNVRGLAASEERGRYNALALNKYMMDRQLNKKGNASTPLGGDEDWTQRWRKFKYTYCNPQDNNWNNEAGSGLEIACDVEGGGETKRLNNDIDYIKLIDKSRTLDVAFDQTENASTSENREDVIALANNLFAHRKPPQFEKNILSDNNTKDQAQKTYMAMRALAAKRNVAQNSFNAIVKLKSSGGVNNDQSSSARNFLGAILKEIGLPVSEINDYIGEDPSYYAQLEILSKKLYQHPDFFVNLFDKPANVARKSVALKAIELMLDRAIYESHLRREIATSVLLSTKLSKKFVSYNDTITNTDNE